MTTFGFSAFLKYVSLSERRQASELRKRLGPVRSSGYDFHRRMRQLARRRLAGAATLADVLASAAQITSDRERSSAIAALERLEAWRTEMRDDVVSVGSVTYKSPQSLFKIRFEPDFGLRIRGNTTAIHLWNTKTIKLAEGPTYAALALVHQAYGEQESPPEDVGVLSIREPARLYLLSEVSDRSAAAVSIVEALEKAILGPSTRSIPADDRPQA